jgi:hypothetical protein
MIAKDIIQNAGVTFAVVKTNYRVSAKAIAAQSVMRHHSDEVTLVNTDYYDVDGWNSNSLDKDSFTKSPAGQKGGKGFLVVDENNRYSVRRAGAFVAVYSDMESLWADQEAKAQNERAQALVLEEIRRDAHATVQGQADALKESTQRVLKSLLPAKEFEEVSVYTSVDGDWTHDRSDMNAKPVYTTKVGGNVSIPINTFQRLLEVILEAQDALA